MATTTHKGSCHCGAVAFEVEGEIDKAISCNCSICRRKGSLLWFAPRSALKLTTPESASRVYEFNHHAIHHRFCPTCGIHPYAEGTDPKSKAPMAAINLRCLENFDFEQVPVQAFDGASR